MLRATPTERRERYRVRGTPTLMLADGTKLRHPIAYPRMEERQVVGVEALPCCGEDCLEATREVIEQALRPKPSSDGDELPSTGNRD